MMLDTQLFYFFNNLAGQSSWGDWLIVFLASYFPYLVAVFLIALVFFSQYPQQKKLEILLVSFISAFVAKYGIIELIRHFIHRPRPFSVLETHQLLTNSAWSFPSGHAAFFFALSTAVYLYNKKWGIGFFIATALMTLARVAAGVHYPSDILAGALIGVAITCLIYWLFQRFAPKNIGQNSPDLLT